MMSKYEAISSFCAIFVAVIALAVAIYEAKVTRQHQEVSVWPYLHFYSTSIAKINGETFPLAMYLKNDGIGPAMVKRLEITYKGKSYNNLGSIFKEIFPSENVLSSDKSIAKVILPQKDVLLVGAAIEQKKVNEFRSKTNEGGLKIDVCYCSLYDKCWEIKEDNESVSVTSCEKS